MFFFFQAEDGIRDLVRSRGLGDVYKRQGSYSGAVPNEKITWGKLDINTPKYIVESDATIVALSLIHI